MFCEAVLYQVSAGVRTRVHLVDDDRAVREALKFALELDGMVVRTWESGSQFLDHGDMAGADCLVLDCKMPDLDGFGVASALGERKVRLPIIMITAPVTDVLRRRARSAGIFCVLEKPLLDGVLGATVRTAISC